MQSDGPYGLVTLQAGNKPGRKELHKMKYTIKMRNPKSGKVEVYTTEAADREDLQLGLNFWESDAGYEILEVTDELNDFYYTFGSDNKYPYCRGWVKVRAMNWEEAHEKFRTRFPDRHEDTLNCAFFYTADGFMKSSMASGRYPDEFCHEVIV